MQDSYHPIALFTYNLPPSQYNDKLQNSCCVGKYDTGATMDQTKELLEMPREFVKDGRQFITRCSKRQYIAIRTVSNCAVF